MLYRSLTLRHLRELTPDEICLGIKLGIEIEAGIRRKEQKRADRLRAVEILSSIAGEYGEECLSEKNIRLCAKIVAEQRDEEDMRAYFQLAKQYLANQGIANPSADQMKGMMLLYVYDSEEIEAFCDREKALRKIRKDRRVWFPANAIPAKQKTPSP